jgi:hypothetical protein
MHATFGPVIFLGTGGGGAAIMGVGRIAMVVLMVAIVLAMVYAYSKQDGGGGGGFLPPPAPCPQDPHDDPPPPPPRPPDDDPLSLRNDDPIVPPIPFGHGDEVDALVDRKRQESGWKEGFSQSGGSMHDQLFWADLHAELRELNANMRALRMRP